MTPDQPQRAASDPAPNEQHRLAGSASGTGGGSGNTPDPAREILALLRAALDTLTPPTRAPSDDPATFDAWAVDTNRRRHQAHELEAAAGRLYDAETQTSITRRRLDRRVRNIERDLETQARHVDGGRYAGQRHRGMPVRVVVDPDAWAIITADSLRRRHSIGDALGQLLTKTTINGIEHLVEDLVEDAVEAAQRPVEPSTRPLRHLQARAVTTTETRDHLRALAHTHQLTTARLIGHIIEHAAHQLGWRR